MIIVQFGKSGRLAQICEKTLKLTYANAMIYNVNRDGKFTSDSYDGRPVTQNSVEALLKAYPEYKCIVVDASVDHSSIQALITHETFKRETIATICRYGVLDRTIGFSSGITLLEVNRILPDAVHMLEYRRQKLAQQEQFLNLPCPVFLPRLFTLVGPITYAVQGAAWAQVLKARLKRETGTVLNEPQARKAWTSEFQVTRAVLNFLAEPTPISTMETIVSGEFTLAQIADDVSLPLPALTYTLGQRAGWLVGDYLPPQAIREPLFIHDELLRSLFH